jgi:predicted Rossmann fold flavoprotein
MYHHFANGRENSLSVMKCLSRRSQRSVLEPVKHFWRRRLMSPHLWPTATIALMSLLTDSRWLFTASCFRTVAALNSSPSIAAREPFLNKVQKGKRKIAVIGGGASGMFAAIHAADKAAVTVFEAGSQTLTKVKISGGGRCNVLHDCSKPPNELLAGYPRGSKELRGILSKHFPVTSAAAWFQDRGVELKTEPDGRMFPTTDSSQTIIDALLSSAEAASVKILLRTKVDAVESRQGEALPSWQVTYTAKGANDAGQSDKSTRTETFDAVILATGSAPAGYALVRDSHNFVETVPSLFTLNCKHAVKEGNLLHGLSGVSVPKGRVSFKVPSLVLTTSSDAATLTTSKQRKPTWIQQEGPLLITHSGLSGPAALRLSAFGARDFAAANYRGDLSIHWAPDLGTVGDIFDLLWGTTLSNPKKTIASQCPLLVNSVGKDGKTSTSTAVPKRLWSAFVKQASIDESLVWGQVGKKLVRSLAELVAACPLELTGKGTFKEEFVTAGGVSLSAIDMKTMQSKSSPGLFFCGELINVDGVTGGFNFLNCWATGFVAGTSAAEFVRNAANEASHK